MLNGDKDVLEQVNDAVGKNLIPFAYSPNSNLSGYFDEIEIADAIVSDDGELTGSKLGKITGEPAILQYIIARANLEGKETLSKKELENYLVPKNLGACVAALEQMDIWAQRKPTLTSKLDNIQNEIDDLVLASFTVLNDNDRKYIKKRVNEFPLNKVLFPDKPGATTRVIPVKYWKTGDRYKG
jgi:hypothetical protein